MHRRINNNPNHIPRQSCNWCFTLNNYTEDEVLLLGGLTNEPHPFEISSSVVKALACSEEIAPVTGTPHLQGYLQLSKKGTFLGSQVQG